MTNSSASSVIKGMQIKTTGDIPFKSTEKIQKSNNTRFWKEYGSTETLIHYCIIEIGTNPLENNAII